MLKAILICAVLALLVKSGYAYGDLLMSLKGVR